MCRPLYSASALPILAIPIWLKVLIVRYSRDSVCTMGLAIQFWGLNFADELCCWNWRLSQTEPSNLSTLPILTTPNVEALFDSRPLGMKYAIMLSIWGLNFAYEHCCYELQSGWLWAVFSCIQFTFTCQASHLLEGLSPQQKKKVDSLAIQLLYFGEFKLLFSSSVSCGFCECKIHKGWFRGARGGYQFDLWRIFATKAEVSR